MVDGFINDDFTADGSITGSTCAIANQLEAGAFDGAFSSGVIGGWVSNLGITYSGSVLSVASADGTALSSSNPGYVILPSKASPGLLTKYTITSDQGFIDDTGASEIINNLFGLTTGVAYTEDIPFYIYAVTNDAETHIQFMICRVSGIYKSPTAANIGAPDDAVADTQKSFFSFDNIDETLYNDNPCICIGSFRMRMSAADDWTVQALDFQDGIGRFQEGRLFTFPTGVFGAAAGTHWIDNGGTAPVFTSETYFYNMYADGTINLFYQGSGVSNAPAGAVNSQFTLPYQFYTSRGFSMSRWDSTGVGNFPLGARYDINLNYSNFIELSTFLQNADIAAGDNFFIQDRFHIDTRT